MIQSLASADPWAQLLFVAVISIVTLEALWALGILTAESQK